MALVVENEPVLFRRTTARRAHVSAAYVIGVMKMGENTLVGGWSLDILSQTWCFDGQV